MCGIGAVITKNKNTLPYIKRILTLQEHRGRSSSGVAYLKNNQIIVNKSLLTPSELAKTLNENSNAMICHGRAPSIGAVKVENAHPFVDCKNNFALVHNGTIYNYELLKLTLREKHEIKGETDAEILTHFIEENLKYHKISDILKNISGQNIIILFRDKLVGVGDDLIICRDKNGVYIAQEMSVFNDLFKNMRKIIYRVKEMENGYFEISLNLTKFYLENFVKERIVLSSEKKQKQNQNQNREYNINNFLQNIPENALIWENENENGSGNIWDFERE